MIAIVFGLLVLGLPFLLPLAMVPLRRRLRRIEPPVVPPPGPALSSKATRVAFELYALRTFWMVPAGLLWMAALNGLSPRVASAGFFVSLFGVFCIWNAARVWWRLRRNPWREHRCRYMRVAGRGNGYPILVLDPERTEDQPVLEIRGFVWRFRRFDACDGATVWVAGDPAGTCVVALPGGTHFMSAGYPLWPGRRERLRRRVLERPLGQADLSPYAVQLDQPG